MPQLAELFPLLLVNQGGGRPITLVKMPLKGIRMDTKPFTVDLRISLVKLEK
jgi:hypothetical protein